MFMSQFGKRCFLWVVNGSHVRKQGLADNILDVYQRTDVWWWFSLI